MGALCVSARAVIAALVAGLVRGASFQGSLPQSKDFVEYIGKFCFDSYAGEEAVGRLEMGAFVADNVTVPAKGAMLLFMIFDDEGAHWKRIENSWSSASCSEMQASASHVVDVTFEEDRMSVDYNVVIHQRVRPRFWYFVFASCGHDYTDLPVYYSIHVTNMLLAWQSEFSMDRVGIFWVHLVSLVAFAAAASWLVWVSSCRGGIGRVPLKDHPYIQLLTLSHAASVASSALFLAHYGLFQRDGYGSRRLRFLGIFGAIVASCTMYLIAILASSGWAITSATFTNRGRFLWLVTFVGVLHAACELQAQTTIDQSTKLYSYQGPVGVAALALKMFIFCWFAVQAKATYVAELDGQRRRFYKCLVVIVAAWSLALPVVALLAWVLDPWVRYKVVTGLEVATRFLGLSMLTFLFCGPLSPITEKNTFRFARHSDADPLDLYMAQDT